LRLLVVEQVFDILEFRQQALATFKVSRAVIGQRDLARGPLQQAYANALFHRLDGVGHGRRR